MANTARKKGTRKERELVQFFESRGWKAFRLALGGVSDGEDVMVETPRFGGVRVQVKYRRSTKNWRVAQWAAEVAARRKGEWWVLIVPVPNKTMDRALVVFDSEAADEWRLTAEETVTTPAGLASLEKPGVFRGWCVAPLANWAEAVG